MIQEALAQLVQRHDLTREQAGEALHEIMTGQVPPILIGAFLAALATKGETVDEITGLAETMRAMATKVPTRRRPLVDTCGTGGDRAGTFNISTTAAFVVAGTGVAVAKHGNRAASSICGSADVLEELGVNVEATSDKVGACLDEIGIGFLFARTLHTAMKHVAPVRTELKVRTVFNLLGPLTNPAGACGQVVGVPRRELVDPLAQVLAQLGTRHAFVVSGFDGLDEISLTGPTYVAEAFEGNVSHYELHLERVGMQPVQRDALLGGDAKHNAAILRAVLEGEPGPRRNIVILNAAPAIVAGMGAADLAEGIAAATASIDSGAARQKLDDLVKYSHDS